MREYFDAFGRILGPDWAFTHRQRRPPPAAGPGQRLLSFGYTLLAAEATTACEVANLDPHRRDGIALCLSAHGLSRLGPPSSSRRYNHGSVSPSACADSAPRVRRRSGWRRRTGLAEQPGQRVEFVAQSGHLPTCPVHQLRGQRRPRHSNDRHGTDADDRELIGDRL
jgi:hypothetical protein